METPVQGLGQTLQMQITEATPERVVMTMPVTAQHRQPWGYLHGGASVALAETAATVGAFLNCPPGMIAFGQEINANHLRSVREGLLTATAVPLHVGSSRMLVLRPMLPSARSQKSSMTRSSRSMSKGSCSRCKRRFR